MIDAGTLIADRYRILEQLPALPGMRRYSAQNSNGHSVVLLEGDSYSTLRLSRAADALQRVITHTQVYPQSLRPLRQPTQPI
jgi:hypothetical protein